MLRELIATNNQLQSVLSQMRTDVADLKADIASLRNAAALTNATGEVKQEIT